MHPSTLVSRVGTKPRSQTRGPDLKAERNTGAGLNTPTKSISGLLKQILLLTIIVRRIRHLEALQRKPISQVVSRATVYLR